MIILLSFAFKNLVNLNHYHLVAVKKQTSKKAESLKNIQILIWRKIVLFIIGFGIEPNKQSRLCGNGNNFDIETFFDIPMHWI